MSYCTQCVEKYGKYFYLVFRVLVGVLFFLHGWGKFWGASPVPAASIFGLAGVIELVVGAFLVLGLFTRAGAVVAAVEMLVAYFMVHAPNGWNPLANGGELALLFLAAFLVVLVYGNGTWSVEKSWLGKELF